MRFKYYLRGAGMGILIATVVLIVSLHLQEKQSDGGQTGVPAAEDETITTETESAGTEQEDLTRAGDGAGEASDAPAEAEAQDVPAEPDTETAEDGETLVTVTVETGEVCRDIANDLAEKGLVEDAEEFRLYMDENGYDSGIHVGVFEIPAGATYEEIAKILAE